MPLNEYVDYIPVLIDGPPEIVALTLDVHEDFVQMPHVSYPGDVGDSVRTVVRTSYTTAEPSRK
jgi:hypothetical protein